MKTNEFKSLLENANTVKEIAELRNTCKSSHYVNECKRKIRKIYENEGFSWDLISKKTLSNLTNQTQCGQFFEFEVPEKSRIFKRYKNVLGYVLAKEGREFQKVEILVKENK